MTHGPAAVAPNPPQLRLDVADLRRRFRCSRATIERWLRRGVLPPPQFVLQRRVWTVEVIEEAARKLHEMHEGAVSGVAGMAIARRAAARAAEARELARLEMAAVAFLGRRSAGDLARVILRFASDGKIGSIPSDRRAAALRALGAAE